MAMSKSVYEERKETINHVTGEIEETSTLKTVKHDKEPDFVKLYIQDICMLNRVPKTSNNVLNELLKYVNYKNEIVLATGIKDIIIKELGSSRGSLDNSISKLVKAEILKRIGRGIYKLNPNLFGRGHWKDIKEIRATWLYKDTKDERELEVINITNRGDLIDIPIDDHNILFGEEEEIEVEVTKG